MKATAQWCSPGILTRGALQKCPELVGVGGGGGGGVQYDILEILNFVGVYSSNCGTNITPRFATGLSQVVENRIAAALCQQLATGLKFEFFKSYF